MKDFVMPPDTGMPGKEGAIAVLLRSLVLVCALATFVPAPSYAQDALPDPIRTPGAINPAVTQETIGTTICMRGWTRTIRLPAIRGDGATRVG